MVICVIGDVHGNLPALEAVLEKAGDCDDFWCIGDTVGYGPFPDECINEVRLTCPVSVAGNHDLGSIGKISLDSFNADARVACEWTGRIITDESRLYLDGLPMRHETGGVLLVHGSPRNPIWEYVISTREAAPNLEAMTEPLCFHGHSHAPAVFARKDGDYLRMGPLGDGTAVELLEGAKYLVNVGSVGQPRDGDARACYVEYRPDERMVSYHRVEYPIERTQKMMEEAGLPGFLIGRLAIGR